MLKSLKIGLILIIFTTLFPSSAQAVGEFNTSYNISYEITESGETRVTQDITLTNNTDNYYATSFGIVTGFTRVTGVESYDQKGQQQVGITQKDNETTIKINFNGMVVGRGNQYRWTLKFNTKDVAVKSGKIWEINIPKLGSGDYIDDYNVRLVIPKSFGNPTFITPKPIRELIFNKQQLLKSGITAIFGEYQLYDFDLAYHLKNEKPTPILTEVAFPPNTEYQKVTITEINPKPQNILTDMDKNWLALYKLSGSETLNIRIKGQVTSFMSPQKKVTLTDEERKAFTKPLKYWESDNQAIIERAEKLKTAQEIYDFVENTLSYNYKRVTTEQNRLGGIEALKQPENAVCTEFTDLFISLARAAGIPARELDGFANTENSILRPLSLEKDILHAWPEYYDDEKKTWIQVDPTWGNTTKGIDYFGKLDFNHVAFVVKGNDSTYPYPAGSYKQEDTKDKDVQVTATGLEIKPNISDFDIVFDVPKSIISGIDYQGKLKITNPNPIGYSNVLPNLQGDPIDVKLLSNQELQLPPYSNIELPFKLNKTSLLDSREETLILKIENQKKEIKIDIQPFFPLKFWPLTLAIILSLVIIIKKGRYAKSHKENNIRSS